MGEFAVISAKGKNEQTQALVGELKPSRLAITLGDPCGIGPEVILKALAGQSLAALTVVGSRRILEAAYTTLRSRTSEPLVDPQQLDILEPILESSTPLRPGCPSPESGAASFAYLQAALDQVLAGPCQGIVTAPIAKSVWKQAGHDFPGQTEVLAQGAGVERYGMLFVATSPHTGWQLKTLLATTHIPLQQVCAALCPGLLSLKLDLLIETLAQQFGVTQPRIAIAGLNPHSGEQGQLGREEIDWLIPWLEEMRSHYPHVTLNGPVPPDTLWVKPGQAWFGHGGAAPDTLGHDAYLALYHDQGLIPVKLMAFDRAVNTTIGLPFTRTSPDHGTAFDIAGQGIADASSMKAAIALARQLANPSRSA
ncbi:4-hydroxythreonine-4-phosphate dehydrogenase PdxA [Synechococcales cyanobacterium C]|uniref:4-hydroxythreonine-4-phosphate dehydrogenase n=1 Tax=Petrachloros mirabilis ULC683 TaxID=2781853 RepID=A0A8K2A7Y0_9CYAN|nr:4-hydroxythreonine-4-phosphate dehydrogenase PdxA [Petrachloros mirabilis]NCJ07399.1 4-hydroxythreonine-4-phosphate dehydrogenase PdxA [Petrachloros mirabilis ULC683]